MVADTLAVYVDTVFGNMTEFSSKSIMVATIFFGVQIYCDFSGYTDMARDLARIVGIRLMENFRYPYFALSIQDFWRRWHISLSTWLRDYLYISLGGNRRGKVRTYVNLMATMILGGLWHGANYNFVLWGGFHGGLLCLERYFRGVLPASFVVPKPVAWATTMVLVFIGWFIFRIEEIADASVFWIKLFVEDSGFHHYPQVPQLFAFAMFAGVILLERFAIRQRLHLETLSLPAKATLSTAVGLALYFGAPPLDQAFVYFQF